MTKKEDRPLDPVYQDVEDSFAGRLALIERAAKNTRAKKAYAEVLGWYLAHHAEERPVIAKPGEIAASFWVEHSERTVQKANAHWKRVGALTFQPRQSDNGSNLPPWASLDWRTVVQLASVQSAGTVREISTGVRVTESRRNSTVDRDGSFFLADGGLTGPPSPGDGPPSPGDGPPSPAERLYTDSGGSPCASLALAWRSRAVVLAAARAVCFCNCNCSSFDEQAAREASKDEVAALAAAAGRAIWPGGVPYDALGTLYAAAAASKLLFSDAWLLRSATDVGRAWREPGSKVRNPLKFLVGALRVNLTKIEGLQEFASIPEGRDWLGRLLWPFENGVREWLPPPPAQVKTPANTVSPPQPSREEREAAQRRLNQSEADKLRRLRGETEASR